MDRKIAVVTGCSSGFGLLVALELAKKGFYVIATMRDTNKSGDLLDEARKLRIEENITVQQLDVTSASSIEKLRVFFAEVGRIDVLVNNAGYAGAGFVEEIPLHEYRGQFETNFFGAIAVTQVFLPYMRTQKYGTIINISSISGRMGFPGLSPYVASKHALEGWSECLRLEMQPFGVKVILIEPGSFQTDIWTTGKKISVNSLQTTSPYRQLMNKIQAYIDTNLPNFGNPKEAAVKIVQAALEKEPNLRYPLGKGTKRTLFLKRIIGWKTWEKLFLKILYK